MYYNIILDKPLKQSIEIEKIGITISPLGEEEKNNIISRMDTLFFSPKAKRKILKYINLEGARTVNRKEFYDFFDTMDEIERKVCYMCEKAKRNGCQYNKRNFNKVINNMVKIECSDNFKNYINQKYVEYFLNNIFKFLLYIKEKKTLENSTDFFVSKHIEDCDTVDVISLAFKFFNSSPENEIYYPIVELRYEDFYLFKNFINRLSVDRIRDFIIITESLFNSHNVIENKIVSSVSILERLLIKHDTNYDIGKQFSLKIGLLLKEHHKPFEEEDVKKLTYCYAIRSCIVHGDDKSIVNFPKKYLKINEEELDKLVIAEGHYNKRDRAVFLCSFFLEIYMKTPLQQWFYDTEKIEFLKNN